MRERSQQPEEGSPSRGGEADPDRRAVRPRHEGEEDTADRRDDDSRRRNPRPAPTGEPDQFEEFTGTERDPSEARESPGASASNPD